MSYLRKTFGKSLFPSWREKRKFISIKHFFTTSMIRPHIEMTNVNYQVISNVHHKHTTFQPVNQHPVRFAVLLMDHLSMYLHLVLAVPKFFNISHARSLSLLHLHNVWRCYATKTTACNVFSLVPMLHLVNMLRGDASEILYVLTHHIRSTQSRSTSWSAKNTRTKYACCTTDMKDDRILV